MRIARESAWVDYICSGEGDIAFIEFMKAFLDRMHESATINGIFTRKSSPFEIALTSPVMEMNKLPYPDYDDYFLACDSSSLRDQFTPGLVIETSRGCWWEEKSHCTFCGLNGSNMKYMSKSVEHAIRELHYLIQRHKQKIVQVADNILDIEYIEQLFPIINARKMNVEIFYETKANLSKNQLLTMAKGGVTDLQPGIRTQYYSSYS